MSNNRVIWFWQLMISPHMVNLAKELAKLNITVNYVIKEELSPERKLLGWSNDSMEGVNFYNIQRTNFNHLLQTSSSKAIHIVQGLRGNEYITDVMQSFKTHNLKFWVIMETVNNDGLKGKIKNHLYKSIYKKYKNNISGFLSIGYKSPKWLENIGVPNEIIFPFTYFLQPSTTEALTASSSNFIFMFAGSFTQRKQPKLILESLMKLNINKNNDIELWMVGGGEQEEELKEFSKSCSFNIQWLGYQDIKVVRTFMAKVDCLLLPSKYDGWGAVVSEAMIEGTPAICSDRCGVAGVVKDSGFGGVFKTESSQDFLQLLQTIYNKGKVLDENRIILKKWSQCLTSLLGANYLNDILFNDRKITTPPWKKNNYTY